MPPNKRSMRKAAPIPVTRPFLLPLLFLTCLSACARTDDITIYATARGRGWLWSRPADAGKKSGEVGGYAVLKNLYSLDKGPKLAVDLGNWFGETPEGYLTKGLSVAECMNAVGYSIAAAGPEDLSLPPAELEKLVRASSCAVLASNLYLRNNRKPSFIKSQHIETVGGARIGFLAVTVMTPEKFGVQRFLPNYKLEKESYEIERSMRALKDAGAGLTVMLLGINPKKRAEKDFYGAFLRKLPHIDLVITDEPGLKKPLKAGRTWIVPVPNKLAGAARIRLGLDPETKRLVRVKAETVSLEKARYGEDLAVLGTVNRQRGAISKIFSRRLGSAAADMPRREGRTSPLGNFTADCIRRWARSDAAVVNNSVLGGDILKGPVTAGDLHRVIAA
ncbi:MAG TPA: 5'-nucleotidase C-terminal domain-containing protein, partial [Elusimicrobiales bacterium]|nr:5'-nucleotidase C-terminal domain-containing protein [Elusimicrobiales bacterium]